LRGPIQRAAGGREKCFTCERKGNHEAAVMPASGSI
jgi:hypothetical protein